MTPTMRTAGVPSPLAAGTHDDAGLAAAFPFEPGIGQAADPLAHATVLELDPFSIGDDAPGWMTQGTRLIRPICVGALMSIPTLGPATVGAVAAFNGDAADRMVRASIAFLNGIPGEVLLLIGTLATGYGFAKTVERLKGDRK